MLKSTLKDQILSAAKSYLDKPEMNASHLIESLLADDGMIQKVASKKSKNKTKPIEPLDWETIKKATNFQYIENGNKIQKLPSYMRVFGEYNYYVEVEVRRRPGLTDSQLIVTAYKKPDKKNFLRNQTRWLHISSDGDRYDLNVSTQYYQLSPRDAGRCIEVRVQPKEKNYLGHCIVIYGPIQLPNPVRENLKQIIPEGVLQMRAVGTYENDPDGFSRIKVDTENIIPFETSTQGELPAIPITSEMLSRPSMNDSLMVHVEGSTEDVAMKFETHEDKDLFILFLQYMIRRKRFEEGLEPPSIDPSFQVSKSLKKKKKHVDHNTGRSKSVKAKLGNLLTSAKNSELAGDTVNLISSIFKDAKGSLLAGKNNEEEDAEPLKGKSTVSKILASTQNPKSHEVSFTSDSKSANKQFMSKLKQSALQAKDSVLDAIHMPKFTQQEKEENSAPQSNRPFSRDMVLEEYDTKDNQEYPTLKILKPTLIDEEEPSVLKKFAEKAKTLMSGMSTNDKIDFVQQLEKMKGESAMLRSQNKELTEKYRKLR